MGGKIDEVRDGPDGLYILCDIITDCAVATGQRSDKHAVLVCEADGSAVKFEFAAVLDGAVCHLADTFIERVELFDIVSIAEREHREAVTVLGKTLCAVASNCLGRRGLREIFGEHLLKCGELAGQQVVFEVADGRGVLDIIAVIMPSELL